MASLDSTCIYDDSDEDCYKCVKHGYVWSCAGCQDYDDGMGHKGKRDEEWME